VLGSIGKVINVSRNHGCIGSGPLEGSAHYLLVSSLQLHVFELPEAAHGLHLLQVSVEGQSAQTEAVASVADGLQPLHLFNDGGHGYRGRQGGRQEFDIRLARNRLITQSVV